jgi:serine/threonine protein kinase
MSPEQARGEAIDARSDLFSLGSVLYAICTGRPPFRAETAYGLLRRLTDSEPRPIREINPDVPQFLEAIICRLHAKNPADRFDTAEEVAELLEQCLAHLQQPTEFPLPPQLAPKPIPSKVEAAPHGASRRRRWLVTISGTIALCVVLGVVIARRPETQRAVPLSPGKTTASETSSTTAASSVATTGDPALEWDAAARAIEGLSRDGDDFQQRVTSPWSDSPPRPTSANETLLPSASESQP